MIVRYGTSHQPGGCAFGGGAAAIAAAQLSSESAFKTNLHAIAMVDNIDIFMTLTPGCAARCQPATLVPSAVEWDGH